MAETPASSSKTPTLHETRAPVAMPMTAEEGRETPAARRLGGPGPGPRSPRFGRDQRRLLTVNSAGAFGQVVGDLSHGGHDGRLVPAVADEPPEVAQRPHLLPAIDALARSRQPIQRGPSQRRPQLAADDTAQLSRYGGSDAVLGKPGYKRPDPT